MIRQQRPLKTRRSATVATTCLLLLTAWGCGGGPETALVAGQVTFDGSPLDDARVEFDHRDGSPPVTLEIKAGAFSGEVLVGEKTVRFFALRPNKRPPGLSPTDVINPVANILPDAYGYDSQLTLEVGGETPTEDLRYELKSKK